MKEEKGHDEMAPVLTGRKGEHRAGRGQPLHFIEKTVSDGRRAGKRRQTICTVARDEVNSGCTERRCGVCEFRALFVLCVRIS